MSIRQKRKLQRTEKKDKWGQPMNLSRKERRAARRSKISCSYKTAKSNVVTLQIGEHMIKDNIGSSDHYLYGGGSLQYH